MFCRRTLLAPAPATSKAPATAKPAANKTATTPKSTTPVVPAGFQKITCDPTPVPGKPYQLNPTGKVCGVWYDEIACQQVDGGSTFAGSPDVCCAPKATKGDDWPNFSNCITLKKASKTPVKCAKTGAWTQKVCCVKQVCKV
jgi:hypothetical protein